MQGWGPDWIPRLAEHVVEAGWIDDHVPVAGSDAMRLSRELARKEGIFTGITGGATLAGALTVAEAAPRGSTILCMLPDTGERYLTTPLFEDIAVTMTEEEVAISQSTPRFRFDAPSAPPPSAPSSEAPSKPGETHVSTPAAEAFVAELVADSAQPVVMFSHEWCEFCWSVRKLFKAMDVTYRSVDLDSVAYQENNWGGQIRGALKARLDSPTIPQIFVGGDHIGGCTETFDAYNDGRLQALLTENGITAKTDLGVDAYSFLPNWLHPR